MNEEVERGFCLLKGIAEGTYNSKHAEAARLYYTTTTTTTTTHIHTHTHLQSKKGKKLNACVPYWGRESINQSENMSFGFLLRYSVCYYAIYYATGGTSE